MEFNPFDMFRNATPHNQSPYNNFPRNATPQNPYNNFPSNAMPQSPYNNFPNNAMPQMHENDPWGWPFTIPGRRPPNDPKPNARQDSSSHRAPQYPSTPKRKGRVFTVPVYDGTESPSVVSKAKGAPRMDRTVAAVKIQSTFRGFCVRHSRPLEKLRIISKVKLDAEKIAFTFADARQTHDMRQNEEARIKLNNQITSLLLRLDSIQGVNTFVRESRKAVNRQVFQLQETVDAIMAGKSMEGAGLIGYGHTDEVDCRSQMREYHHEWEAIAGGVAVAETENETLERLLSNLWRQTESRDELINDLSIRVAQLEQQLFEEKQEE